MKLTTSLFLFSTIFIIVLMLYGFTLAPGVVGGDAGEHQFVAPLLGIPHATGYPFYVLLGNLWTHLIPFGNFAWRMNLLSAVAGAIAAGVTGLVVLYISSRTFNQPKPRLSGALMAGLTLAFGLTLWQWSSIAGVRSINVLFFGLMTLLAVLWEQSHSKFWTTHHNRFWSSERLLQGLAFTVGLSLAHHRTTIFYLPALIIWVGWHNPQLLRQPKQLIKLIGLTLLPLSLYGFIYVRGINNPPYSHELITDFQSFWFLVGASDSSGLFLYVDPQYLIPRLLFTWNDILAQLGWPGLLLAVCGAGFLLWKQPKYLLFTGSLVLFLLIFVIDFEVVNLNETPTWYLMPAYFIFAVWSGIGFNGIANVFRKTEQTNNAHITNLPARYSFTFIAYPSSLIFYLCSTMYLLSLIIFLAYPNWQRIQADSTGPLDEWRQLLRGNQAQRFVESSLPYVESNALLLGDWEQYTPMMYYRLINQVRLDTTPRLPLDEWPQKVALAHDQGQPVYFMRKTTDLIGTSYLSMVGPLIHLQTEPNFEPPDDIIGVEANLEDELILLGYRLQIVPQSSTSTIQPESIMQITLYWQAYHNLSWDYALSLRLLSSTGEELYKRDTSHPVLSSYPTSLWQTGEVVGDFYELPLPTSNDTVALWIIPYRSEAPGQWYNLTYNGQTGVKIEPIIQATTDF